MVTPYSGGPSSFELLALPSGILDYFLRSVLDGADRARMRFMCRAVRERLRFYPLMELPDTILDHFLLKTLGAEEKTSVMTASKALLARFRAAADRVARSAGETATFRGQHGTVPQTLYEVDMLANRERNQHADDPYMMDTPPSIAQGRAVAMGTAAARPLTATSRHYVPNLADRWALTPGQARRCCALYAYMLQYNVKELEGTSLSDLTYYVRLAFSFLSSHEFTFNHTVKRSSAAPAHCAMCRPHLCQERLFDDPRPFWPQGFMTSFWTESRAANFKGAGIPCSRCMEYSWDVSKPQFIRIVVTSFVLWTEPRLLRQVLTREDAQLQDLKDLLVPPWTVLRNVSSARRAREGIPNAPARTDRMPLDHCITEAEDLLSLLLLEERGYSTPPTQPTTRRQLFLARGGRSHGPSPGLAALHWRRYRERIAAARPWDRIMPDKVTHGWWAEMRDFLTAGQADGIAALGLALVYTVRQDHALHVLQHHNAWWCRPHVYTLACQHTVFGPVYATLIRMALTAQTNQSGRLQRVVQQQWPEIVQMARSIWDVPRPHIEGDNVWAAARQWRSNDSCDALCGTDRLRTAKTMAPGVYPWNLPNGQLDPDREPFWEPSRAHAATAEMVVLARTNRWAGPDPDWEEGQTADSDGNDSQWESDYLAWLHAHAV